METKNPASKLYNPMFYRLFYGLFIVLSVYYIFSNQLDNAVTNMGIALIFDPFNPTISWPQRKWWHKAWLLGHLTFVMAGFTYLIIQYFNK
jgi:hypothetical protein